MAVVMIVGASKDYEMILTGDLFKIAWKDNDFVSQISVLQRKLAMVLSKNQICDPGPS